MIKELKIKTSTLFSLVFANNTFFIMLLFLFMNYWLIVQIFNPTAELVIPIGIPTKEAKAEIQAYPVTEDKSRCSI